MVIRIFITAALIVLGAGFMWFAGTVVYLGVKEFFRQKKEGYASEPSPAKPSASAPDASYAPEAPVPEALKTA